MLESATPQLKPMTNGHVERLHRFLPFSPLMEQIYEEYTDPKDSMDLDTVALDYLQRVVTLSNAKLVILTGDAGHGKTHLCRRLLEEHIGGDSRINAKTRAKELITTDCDGSKSIPPSQEKPNRRPLRIYKDFSELSITLAADQIELAMRNDADVTVICANEGRLRAVLESASAGEGCSALLSDFNRSFEDGLASRDGIVHVLNLNYQSVAAPSVGDGSLLQRSVKAWNDGTRWKACEQCSSKSACPIYRNHQLLSHTKDTLGENRQHKLVDVFATAERLGVVITIREMLMAVAYLLTGGLKCEDVHRMTARSKRGWQHRFAFYNLAFEPPSKAISQKLSKIPVIQHLSKLDPGRVSARSVDERLINEHNMFQAGDIDIVFTGRLAGKDHLIDASSGIDEIIGNPRNRLEREGEADFVITVVRSLRRRFFFDDCTELPVTMRRMGFSNGGDFTAILSGNLSPALLAPLKNRAIAGLHMIQGIKLGPNETRLMLVDPAFGNATSHAAIIARRIPSGAIKLLPMREKWHYTNSDKEFAMTTAVDWLDRHIVLRIDDKDEDPADLSLDLMMFDCLMRSARGYVASQFYAHDIRRIDNYLGRLAESGSASDEEISLFMGGSTRSISIDGGVIQVGAH